MDENNQTYGDALDKAIGKAIDTIEEIHKVEVSLHNRLVEMRSRTGLIGLALLPARGATRVLLAYSHYQRARLEFMLYKMELKRKQSTFDSIDEKLRRGEDERW